MTPQDPTPKGSLEELFRHHLLEGEAAAVPPRPFVWEQVENNLLLRENEGYRRRLAGYRWAMAASLLLTLLAGAGWLHTQLNRPTGLAAGRPGERAPAPAGYQPGELSLAASSLAMPTSLFPSTNRYAISQTFTPSPIFASGTPNLYSFYVPGAAYAAAERPARATAGHHPGTAAAELPGIEALLGGATAPLAPASLGAEADPAPAADLLGTRLASLRVPGAAQLPEQLAGKQWHFDELPRPTSPWNLQVAYAAGFYNPNIDFAKSANSYNANLGPGTVATTQDAAAEYRSNLRMGLSQRLSVWATRRLGIGRWSLRTGLEVSQNDATSASSVAFVGTQVATNVNYVQVLPNRLRGSNFRYQTVSVPVEAVYTRPLRHNLSLYGRAGALVSGLLRVRSEVDDSPEVTRDDTPHTGDSPYRHLLVSARGGAGLRYQSPRQSWALNLGPVAETGIMSLNIDPTQSLLNQRRPYSVGLEAGLEFGSWLRPVPPVQP